MLADAAAAIVIAADSDKLGLLSMGALVLGYE